MTSDVEQWMPIPGYEGLYQASSLGQIRRWIAGRFRPLHPTANARGYLEVGLSRGGVSRTDEVHRLIASAFLGPRPDGKQVRHLDGNPLNARLDNLTYGTKSENEQDKIRHGTHNHARKTHCSNGHEFNAKNTYHAPGAPGKRACRVCNTERRRARVARRKDALATPGTPTSPAATRPSRTGDSGTSADGTASQSSSGCGTIRGEAHTDLTQEETP